MSCLQRERKLLVLGTQSTSPCGLSSPGSAWGDDEGGEVGDGDGLEFLLEQVRLSRGGGMDEESDGWDGNG
jgi:hypothetical protein